MAKNNPKAVDKEKPKMKKDVVSTKKQVISAEKKQESDNESTLEQYNLEVDGAEVQVAITKKGLETLY
jgi:hypothetical protein